MPKIFIFFPKHKYYITFYNYEEILINNNDIFLMPSLKDYSRTIFFSTVHKNEKGTMIPRILWCLKTVGGTLSGSMSFTTQLFQFDTPYFRIFIAWLVLGSSVFPGADKTIHCRVLFLQGSG